MPPQLHSVSRHLCEQNAMLLLYRFQFANKCFNLCTTSTMAIYRACLTIMRGEGLTTTSKMTNLTHRRIACSAADSPKGKQLRMYRTLPVDITSRLACTNSSGSEKQWPPEKESVIGDKQ